MSLRLGAKLVKPGELIAISSVEICSLVFHKPDTTPAQLVGAAIFADGAGSAVISSEERGLVIKDSAPFLIPDSQHLMGYDVSDHGFHLRLDRALPEMLLKSAPEQVERFLWKNGLTAGDIPWWLFHPGGTKILDLFEDSFSLHPDQCRWSRDVLGTVGNISSATVLFVLKEFINSKVCESGDKILMVGVGPGLTL